MDYRINAGAGEVDVSFSADEYVTLRQVLENAHRLEESVVAVPDEEINRLAGVFADTALTDGRKSVTLSRAEISEIGAIFLATTSLRYSALKDDAKVGALEDKVQEILGTWPSRDDYALRV